MDSFGVFLNETSILLNTFTEEMVIATKGLSTEIPSLRQRRAIVRELTKPTNNVYLFLKENNPKVRNQLSDFETGITFFLNALKSSPDPVESETIQSALAPMKDLHNSVSSGKSGMNGLIMNMMQMPEVQGNFDSARRAMTEELITLVDIFDQLESILSRAISFGDGM